jgi:hypothetical protein
MEICLEIFSDFSHFLSYGQHNNQPSFQLLENEHYDRPKLLNVHLPNASEPLKLHPIWLRDHCR